VTVTEGDHPGGGKSAPAGPSDDLSTGARAGGRLCRRLAKLAFLVAACVVVSLVLVYQQQQRHQQPQPQPTDVSNDALPRPKSTNSAVPSPVWSTKAPTNVMTVGARCDGRSDDQTTLQAALDRLTPGDTLLIPANRTCAHSGVLSVNVPETTVRGPGTLLATEEAQSSVWMAAPRVTLLDITVVTESTKRWDAMKQMGVRIVAGNTEDQVVGVTVVGAAAAGIFIGGADHYTLRGNTVRDSRADGIHQTDGANSGTLIDNVITRSGDDGVAVVSYRGDGAPCHAIYVDNTLVADQSNGRGISVVGGYDIHYSNVAVDSSDSAAVYFSQEPPSSSDTFGNGNISLEAADLRLSNRNPGVNHGAIFIWAASQGAAVSDIRLKNIRISDTRSNAQGSITLQSSGGSVTEVAISNVTITGSGAPVSETGCVRLNNVPASAYKAVDVTVNGVSRQDHTGY
jgi:parallel beta-helix repeat protein